MRVDDAESEYEKPAVQRGRQNKANSPGTAFIIVILRGEYCIGNKKEEETGCSVVPTCQEDYDKNVDVVVVVASKNDPSRFVSRSLADRNIFLKIFKNRTLTRGACVQNKILLLTAASQTSIHFPFEPSSLVAASPITPTREGIKSKRTPSSLRLCFSNYPLVVAARF